MAPSLAKSLGGLIVSIMTFLGWNISEYSYLLPPQIKQEVVSTETQPLDATTTDVEKNMISIQTLEDESQNKNDIKVAAKNNPTPTQSKNKNIKITTPAAKPKVVVAPPVQTAPKVQPTYYPAPVQIKETIKNEIKNIVNEIDPPKTEIEIKKETANLSVEDKIKQAVVNIYCSRILGNKIQKVTGSGVVIDSSGVILTNAHVAEYFLLAENGGSTNCYIRTGSPAVSSYRAKLVYLPSVWVNANKNNLSLSTLTGTGENDYALLVITDRVRNDAPNIPLAYLNPASSSLSQNQNIFVAGYPAGFSDVRILDSALYELTKPTTVTNISSFSGGTVDVINTGPTSVAEHGSSGGAVVDEQSNLEGLIAATTIDNQTGQKNIQAITLSYIRKSIQNNSGKNLDSLISNARDEADNFEKTTLPILANTLLGN
ncbi:MAG: hypothetical protein JWP09_339 [Candidatus Taylorbacteria bacterium]|nr:hypothetical protein [Candidatus Taylorbacteria bacterium]